MNPMAAKPKQGVGSLWSAMSSGWRGLVARARQAWGQHRAPLRAPAGRAADDEAGPLRNPVSRIKGWAFMSAAVLEDDRAVIVRIDAPGMQREDFSIEVQERALKVRGVRRSQFHQARAGGWQVSQWAYGSFCRYLALPARVQAAQGVAVYRDGVLRIEIPKAERDAVKHIPVQSA